MLEYEATKGLIFGFALIPFWMITIFLINHPFYVKQDVTVLLMISFILSLSSSIFLATSVDVINKNIDDENFIGSMLLSSVFLWAWKAILLFIVYSTGFLLNKYIYLYYYIVIYFTPVVFIFILKLFKEFKKYKK